MDEWLTCLFRINIIANQIAAFLPCRYLFIKKNKQTLSLQALEFFHHQLPNLLLQVPSDQWHWQAKLQWLWLLRGRLTTNPAMTTVSYIAMVPSALALKCLVRDLSFMLQCWLSCKKLSVTDCSPLLSLFSEGIEKVEIVQMDNAVMAAPEMDRNVLDITVTCQGRWLPNPLAKKHLMLMHLMHLLSQTNWCIFLLSSLPKEVCSVILDAECLRPIHTACNMVEPSKECQLVLRHFFNDSGVYCINVSMANDVSLAATSAKVNVDMGT